MKTVVPLFAMLSLCAPGAWAAVPGPLTTLHAIHSLTNAEAAQSLPVAFEATVTYFREYENTLFVQNDGVAIFVLATTNSQLVPGDLVLVRGTTKPSFRPIVVSNDITLLNHGTLPQPIPATFDELIRAQFDCMLVSVHAVVRSADLELSSSAKVRNIALRMLTSGGYIDVTLNSDDASVLNNLLDAEVEITGVASGRFDGKMQITGLLLHVSKVSDMRILNRASASPWSLPVTRMDEILNAYHEQTLSQRIRVQGTITYYEPGSAIVLQNGSKSLWIRTQTFAPLRVGNLADATGFPGVNDGFLMLSVGEIQDNQIQAPITPQPVTVRQLTSSGRVFDLVSIEGDVVTAFRGASQDEYALVSNGFIFSAVYHHPNPADTPSLAPMKQIPVGSKVRVTGICILDKSNPFGREVPFNILMRSSDDITAVAGPPWLSVRNLIIVIGLLLVLVIAGGARSWARERKSRRQIGSLAYVEQRRGKILEDINCSRPLAGILERVTELVSVRLNGAPSWCRVVDGATLGNRPMRLDTAALRIVEHSIAARSGPALGAIYAAFDARTKPNPMETKALATAAELASLAIETSRLYSDLVHRSEFDLLTDVQNRFAMEKTLDAMIHAARQTAGVFGLIYIDLDKFKQVNDVYGHLVGDLYLQEVAQRMKRQLRPGDVLARLGGDEFALLVSEVRNRVAVEEITARLEGCFHEPFIGDGCILNGSASFGIALYPEDADSADSLLRSADAAMYVAKGNKKTIAHLEDLPQPKSELGKQP
jgi:diguanylate cyclase (GGDEF)-like protein